MELIPTEKCNGATLDSFKANGWTDELLVEHGYAAVAPAQATAAQAPSDTVAPVVVQTASGSKVEVKYPSPVPNGLGVTNLAEIENLLNSHSKIKLFINGYTHPQQVLFVAEALARSRGLIK